MRILVVEDEKKVANFIKKRTGRGTLCGGQCLWWGIGTLHGRSEWIRFNRSWFDDSEDRWIGGAQKSPGGSKQCPYIGADRQGQRGGYCEGFRCRLWWLSDKTFEFLEFLARIRALLRREKTDKEPILRIDDLTYLWWPIKSCEMGERLISQPRNTPF